MNKQILIPVTVPHHDYCVNHDSYEICEHFDNEGGHPKCDLDHVFSGYDSLKYDNEGRVPKLPACLNAIETVAD